MTRTFAFLFGLVAATPAFAAKGPFFSLANTDFVVLIAFVAFIGVLFYFKIPSKVSGMLDSRAEGIRSELDEARAIREEAQDLLASYERQQREVQARTDRIIAHAKQEAADAAEKAKEDLQASIERRMKAAEEQIASAEAAAVKEVRDSAIAVAIAAARDVIAKQMTAKDASRMIDDAIGEVGAKLH